MKEDWTSLNGNASGLKPILEKGFIQIEGYYRKEYWEPNRFRTPVPIADGTFSCLNHSRSNTWEILRLNDTESDTLKNRLKNIKDVEEGNKSLLTDRTKQHIEVLNSRASDESQKFFHVDELKKLPSNLQGSIQKDICAYHIS